MAEYNKQLTHNHGLPWPILEGFQTEWQLHAQNGWVLKAALVSNDLSKHKESKAFFNKQNTMLKVVLKTYLVKFFD